jgi:hypothetical protein
MGEVKHRTTIDRRLLEPLRSILLFTISLLVLNPLAFVFFGFMPAYDAAGCCS